MADKILSDIKNDFLTCPLCSKVYSQPKALPCLHTFCRSCLANHVCKNAIKAGDGTLCVFCPNCREICDLPRDGVTSLQDNVLLGRLLDMIHRKMSSHCDVCRDNNEQTTRHAVTTAAAAAAATCVCVKCEDFMCSNCARAHRKTRATRDHNVLKISHLRELYHNSALKEPAVRSKRYRVKRLTSFGSYGNELHDPVGLTINKADDVIISNGNNDIVVFSLDGKFKKSLSQNTFYGNAENCLSNKCVAMTMEGYVAVAMRKDIHGSRRVGVLVKQTMAAREVATCDVTMSKPLLCQPHGMAVLSNNSTVVSDAGKHCLYLFNADNSYVSKVTNT